MIERIVNSKKFQLLFILIFWTLITTISATQLYYRFKGQYEGGWLNVFFRQGSVYIGWAILTPVILTLVNFINKYFTGKWKSAVLHILSAILISVLYSFIFAISSFGFYENVPSFPNHWKNLLISQSASNLLIYLLIAVFSYAVSWYKQYKTSELERVNLKLRNAELNQKLKQSQLNSLRMQLNPHFLFNTLNSVTSLIRTRKNKIAVNVIVKLSQLLRYTIHDSNENLITLKQELSFIKKYLDIEKIRFSERLEIEYEIGDQTENALLPNLILQPLVENSLKHGLSKLEKKGIIIISSELKDQNLILTIEDSGIGIPEKWDWEKNTGIGLKNTVNRLKSMYPDKYKFQIENNKFQGVKVMISIPFQTAEKSITTQNELQEL